MINDLNDESSLSLEMKFNDDLKENEFNFV